MKKYTLAVNAGSSSLKCRLFHNCKDFEIGSPKQIAVIKATGLSSDEVSFSFEPELKNAPRSNDISTHEEAFTYILEQLLSNLDLYHLKSPKDLLVAHRVVHGGDFEHEVEINEETYHELENLESLAPL
jgi:acetate kinase